MADIHILPISRDPIRRARALGALRQRVEAGEVLGDRDHHVRALGASLEAAFDELRLQIPLLSELAALPSTELWALAHALDSWAEALARCATVINTPAALGYCEPNAPTERSIEDCHVHFAVVLQSIGEA